MLSHFVSCMTAELKIWLHLSWNGLNNWFKHDMTIIVMPRNNNLGTVIAVGTAIDGSHGISVLSHEIFILEMRPHRNIAKNYCSGNCPRCKTVVIVFSGVDFMWRGDSCQIYCWTYFHDIFWLLNSLRFQNSVSSWYSAGVFYRILN